MLQVAAPSDGDFILQMSVNQPDVTGRYKDVLSDVRGQPAGQGEKHKTGRFHGLRLAEKREVVSSRRFLRQRGGAGISILTSGVGAPAVERSTPWM